MRILGDSAEWSDLFPYGLIPEILALVMEAWSNFTKPQPLEHEVPLTRRFAEKIRMRNHSGIELPFKIRVETSIPQINTGKEKGRVDLIFDYIGTNREEVYFAFECKRLRIPFESGIQSNVSDYVRDQGMMCFITGKYSEGLEVGGMLGYVMDGNIDQAIYAVKNRIDAKRLELRLLPDESLEQSSVFRENTSVKETRHSLTYRNFTIHHLFLSLNN